MLFLFLNLCVCVCMHVWMHLSLRLQPKYSHWLAGGRRDVSPDNVDRTLCARQTPGPRRELSMETATRKKKTHGVRDVVVVLFFKHMVYVCSIDSWHKDVARS